MKWMLTASASVVLLRENGFGADPNRTGNSQTYTQPLGPSSLAPIKAAGYGTDPDLQKIYKPGDVWPLTMTESQRRTAAKLCDVIIPEDDHSPSASKVNVHDFIDEWISAPYAGHDTDRRRILNGFDWLDAEAQKRFQKNFADLNDSDAEQICLPISAHEQAASEQKEAAAFFSLYRNLTAGGFYTTPEGMKDLQYIGNVPLAKFDGPTEEALRKVGLIDELS
ncbi:MAG TPA: gluconate 2-dehydrogenase subunit 3 family protein [Opitutaceae bacterium]